MKGKDFSRQIFDEFYNSKGRLLRIELKNGKIIDGIFIGFFHGDPDRHEPYIFMWRFVSIEQVDDYRFSPEKYEVLGTMLLQDSIQSVTFK